MPDPTQYVRGPVPVQQSDTASFEYKAPDPDSTGGGYPRWRSWEHDPTSPREGKEDVYLSVHRLCAIAWWFEDGRTAADILRSGEMVGADVHHKLGMPCANIEGELALREHGTHSEITQSQVRAWGEDAKQQARVDGGDRESEGCGECGTDADVLVTSAGFDGKRCLSCAKQAVDGTDHAIEL